MTWRLGNGPEHPPHVDSRAPASAKRAQQRVAAARARPRPFRWDWLYGIPLSIALSVLMFVCLLALEDPEVTRRLVRPADPTPSAPALRSNWADDFPQRIDQVTKAIEHLPIPLAHPAEEPQGSGKVRWRLRRYEASLPAPAEIGTIDALVAPLRGVAPGVTVRVAEGQTGAQVEVGIDGLLTHALSLAWLGRRPRAAIIVDSLGANLLLARELAEIDAPLTFAVRPSQPFSVEVAELARMFGRQVLIDLVMLADADELGQPGVINTSATADQIVTGLDQSLTSLPQAIGVSSLSDGVIAQDRTRLRALLERLKADAVFFVDGSPSAESLACQIAVEIALPCATSSLVIEASNDERNIATQLDALMQLARTHGDVIGIMHPGNATSMALEAALPTFVASGVDLVPVSMIVLEHALANS